jgi:hypothetical protein
MNFVNKNVLTFPFFLGAGAALFVLPMVLKRLR